MSVKKFFPKVESITAQLTIFYSLSIFILILIVSLFFYWAMINVLYHADRQFLSDEIRILQNILENKPNNLIALKQEVTDIPFALKNSVYHYYIRILDDHSKIITQTPEMSAAMQDNNFFDQIQEILLKENKLLFKQSQWWRSQNGREYLLIQTIINVPKINKLRLIQIALDISYQQAVIKQYRYNVIIALFVGALISIILGYLIAQKGLRRLNELTEKTKTITTNALNQRIDPKSWPTELKELGKAFNLMLDRIESSFYKLIGFSDDLAHELRTPLTNLMGETELAISHASSLEEYQRVMESNLEELHRIHQIIENLLFLARTENPQIDLQKELLIVSKEIDVMCRYYQAVADDKNIKLFSEGEGTVFANTIMFRRMLGNILSNALKYTSPGGLVYFNISEINDNSTQIILSDNGIGIAPEHLTKIFDRFYRTDMARTQNTGGIGLGLSIVKSIIDLHQGTVLITSELNKGTTIIITLPKMKKL